MFVKNSKNWLSHGSVLQGAANRNEQNQGQNFITHVQKYCFVEVYANFPEVFVAVPYSKRHCRGFLALFLSWEA